MPGISVPRNAKILFLLNEKPQCHLEVELVQCIELASGRELACECGLQCQHGTWPIFCCTEILRVLRRGEMCTASAAGTAPHPATARGLLSGSSAGVPTQVNVTLVGALGSGKSALTVKYMTGRFIGDYDPDMEDTYCKRETLDGMEMDVLVMDTCDREGRDPERYLHWADAFLIVYSVTSAASFATAQRYLEALSGGSQGPTFQLPLLLVGNKADLETHRQVSCAEGRRVARQFDAAFFEVSAAEETPPVRRIFLEAVRAVLRELERCVPLRALYIDEPHGERRLTRGTGMSSPVRPPRKDNRNSTESSQSSSRFSFLRLKGIFQSQS